MDIERTDTIDVKCSVSKEERERSPAGMRYLHGPFWNDVDSIDGCGQTILPLEKALSFGNARWRCS